MFVAPLNSFPELFTFLDRQLTFRNRRLELVTLLHFYSSLSEVQVFFSLALQVQNLFFLPPPPHQLQLSLNVWNSISPLISEFGQNSSKLMVQNHIGIIVNKWLLVLYLFTLLVFDRHFVLAVRTMLLDDLSKWQVRVEVPKDLYFFIQYNFC